MIQASAQRLSARSRWRLRRLLRVLRHGPADALDALFGRREPTTPPRRLVFVGGPEFRAVGRALRQQLIDLAGLRPEDRVLDVGCGIGRVAGPLTGYLSEAGSYLGFDIVPEGIDWCQRNITPRHPNFRFLLADLHNEVYHPAGRQPARDYRFEIPDADFDVAFATSVFTHMRIPEVERYLSEIARVLRPGGRCMLTFFLLDESSQSRLDAGQTRLALPHRLGPSRCASAREPEQAIAHPESWLRSTMEALGLQILEPIHRGNWSGLETEQSYQDIVVARKRLGDEPSQEKDVETDIEMDVGTGVIAEG